MIIPAIIGIILLVGYALLASERGSQWLLTTALKTSGQDIELSEIKGTLLTEMTFGQVIYMRCDVDISIKDLHFAWQARQLFHSTLAVQKLTADAIVINPRQNCETPPSKNEFTLPESISMLLDLMLDQITINQIIFNPSDQSSLVIEKVSLKAHTQNNQLVLQLENLDYTNLNLNTQLTINLQQPYQIQGASHWRYAYEAENFQGDVQISGNVNTLLLQHDLITPYQINTTLTISEPFSKLTFDTHSQWQTIVIQNEEQQEIILNKGNVSAQGTLDKLSYDLSTSIDTAQASNILLSAIGTANKNLININELVVKHQKTKLSAHGEVNLDEKLKVMLRVIGKDLNPALFFADYPGLLQLDTQIVYSQQNNLQQLQLYIHKLSGQLRGYSLHGSGNIKSDLESVHLKNIILTMGDNELTANGIIANNLDIEVMLQAPQVNQVHQHAQGDLNAMLAIKGSRDHPNINAQLSSKQLSYQDLLSTKNIDLNLQTDGTAAQAIDAQLAIDKIKVKDQDLLDNHVRVNGTLAEHIFSSRLTHQYGALSIDAEGSYDPQQKQWLGIISQLLVSDTQLGEWQNNEAIQISADAENQSIQALCMQQQDQSICLDVINHHINGKMISAKIDNFALKSLQTYLNSYGLIEGYVNARINLSTSFENLWTGSAQLNTRKLSLTATDESEFDEIIEVNTAEFEAQLDQLSKVTLKLESNYGSAVADFAIDNLPTLENATIQQGNIQLNLPDLLFLNPYIKQAVIKQGQAQVAAQISGALKNPKIKGAGSIDSLDFYIPELGTEYQNAQFTLDANDISRIKITGNINAEDKQLTTEGWIAFDEFNKPNYQFSILGERFPVMNTIDIQAAITPDLNIKGDTKNMFIDGNLHIPDLNIIAKKLPDNIDSVSSDEVIVADGQENNQQAGLSIQGEIDLSLGDNASFVGYGLQTELQGGLKITLTEHQPAVGHGVLSMKNAHYSAVGQRLDINKGKVIFSGPIDDPSLDIQIQRSSQDVTVTMLITGKANDPQSQLISNPALSEANKLSYLLTGKSVNSLSSGEGSNLTSAALSLGLSKSSPILQEIGTKFGFDTLSVNAGDDGLQSTALLLGKHLSPRLYITYAKDLFSALGAIQINYRLTDHVSVEVESGTSQTVDLIYSISTD